MSASAVKTKPKVSSHRRCHVWRKRENTGKGDGKRGGEMRVLEVEEQQETGRRCYAPLPGINTSPWVPAHSDAPRPEANHDSGAGSPSPEPSTPSPRRVGPGEHDMLTCGQCQTNFPLGDILVFIEHKRRMCRGPRSGPVSFSKPGENGGLTGIPISPRARSLELGRGSIPVEVGVQVTPGREEDLERSMTPAKGICPKRERGVYMFLPVYGPLELLAHNSVPQTGPPQGPSDSACVCLSAKSRRVN
ncbi:hypothetical protein FQN60_015880 [Etheostoma spectabile]|uniref:BCL-11A-like CCHC zinc finger domain-containing protein n=1 Tax=Etheostoma spectabile TaxID=54343 RepID=A0A5J5CPE3_9PERO|nr:hypothetical protein FQN60_015880 [Etheostoma spectabile]